MGRWVDGQVLVKGTCCHWRILFSRGTAMRRARGLRFGSVAQRHSKHKDLGRVGYQERPNYLGTLTAFEELAAVSVLVDTVLSRDEEGGNRQVGREPQGLAR
mgnify:CR=1 FL=1